MAQAQFFSTEFEANREERAETRREILFVRNQLDQNIVQVFSLQQRVTTLEQSNFWNWLILLFR